MLTPRYYALLVAVLVAPVWLVGCGGSSSPPAGAEGTGVATAEQAPTTGTAAEDTTPPEFYSPFEDTASIEPRVERPFDRFQHPEDGPNLGDVLEQAKAAGEFDPQIPDLPEIDEERVRAAGIRRIESKHLILYTDLPESEAFEELPAVYDLAVPQWCAYFQIEPEQVAQWKVVGCVMQDKERFRTAGLLPEDLPAFLNGYQRDAQFWLYEQPSEYYRRHLLLHEGTHAFMNHLLGDCGPPWYMEGMAERLGTHRWQEGQLTMAYVPGDNEEVPQWGRVKLVREEYEAGRGMSLTEVMQYGPRAHLQVEPYAWCWAACTYLDEHPLTHERFRQMTTRVSDPNFSQSLQRELVEDWPQIAEGWQLFITRMQYGYDVAAEMIHYAPGEPLPAGGAEFTVSASQGWQSTGILLEAGKSYRLTAKGSYTIASDGQPWPCEPGGVTIRYENDLPLGMLIGAIRPDDWQPRGLSPLTTPGAIGLERVVEPELTGTLYLRVNDSPADLRDNAGECQVRIEEAR